MELFQPTVITDGGPWASHNMPCAVCRKESAVLDLNTGIFHPCFTCQQKYELRELPKWKRMIAAPKLFIKDNIDAAIRHEREACADECDRIELSLTTDEPPTGAAIGAAMCAERIRSRSRASKEG